MYVLPCSMLYACISGTKNTARKENNMKKIAGFFIEDPQAGLEYLGKNSYS